MVRNAKAEAEGSKADVEKEAKQVSDESINLAKEQAAKEMEELENKCKTIEENKDREIENLVTDLKTNAKSKMDETVELVKKAIG
jgi:hypothetical protein